MEVSDQTIQGIRETIIECLGMTNVLQLISQERNLGLTKAIELLQSKLLLSLDLTVKR